MINPGCEVLYRARKKNIYTTGKTCDNTKNLIRWLYEKIHGLVPDDMYVKQSCGDPDCINPDHLILISKKDAMNEVRKKYFRPKYSHRGHKLSIEDVKDLLSRKGKMSHEDMDNLAEEKGVTKTHLRRILRGACRSQVYKEFFKDGRQETETKETTAIKTEATA